MKKISLLLLLAILISCNSAMKKDHTPKVATETTTAKKGLPLNSQWILEHFNNVDFAAITKDSYIKINEDMKSFSGKGGCNNINGSIVVSGTSIKFERIVSTRMMCEKTMKQENLFIKNLNETNNFKIDGGELFLYQDNELLMTLESFRN